MPAPYATYPDLEVRWRALSEEEKDKAEALLGDASFWLRQWFPAETARFDAGAADATGALILVCNMVRRALQNTDNIGVSTASEAVGPFNRNRTYSNPDGNLYITAQEQTLIQSGRRAVSMTMTGAGGNTPSYGSLGIDLGPYGSIGGYTR